MVGYLKELPLLTAFFKKLQVTCNSLILLTNSLPTYIHNKKINTVYIKYNV